MKEMVGGCCVCSDERGWPENPLVYCDGSGCTVAVHQACYGIVTVPTGPWFCRKCESQERAARVRCELCPSRDGALKKTDNMGWAHVVCALYIPEVRFGNVTTMEPIILQLIPPERYNKSCYICAEMGKGNRASAGACMQCNKSGCKQQFHVTCAQQLGLLCEEAGNYLDNVKYCGYCQHHYSKLKKGGNVKPIPPYKPISHAEHSSDAPSSPEKEAEKASSSSSSSRQTTDPTSTSSSSKQRKSSSTSKNSVSASGTAPISNNTQTSSNSSTTSSNSSHPSSTSTSSSSGFGSGSSSSSSSKTSSSSSNSSSKDKDKHAKSTSKTSKTHEKESSSSSTSVSQNSSSTKSKYSKSSSSSSSSSNNKDDLSSTNISSTTSHQNSKTEQKSDKPASSTTSNPILQPARLNVVSPSMGSISSVNKQEKHDGMSNSSGNANKESSGGGFGQKFTTSNFTQSIVMKSDSVFGNGGDAKPPTSSSTGATTTSQNSNMSSGGTKKRKSDGRITSGTNVDEINRDIITKDLSVTLTPLTGYDKLEATDPEKSIKKFCISQPKSETTGGVLSATSEPTIQNLTPNIVSSKQQQQQQHSQNVQSNNSATNLVTGKQHLKETSGQQPATSTPSLVVSVPLSTANVPGVNLSNNNNNLSVPFAHQQQHSSIGGPTPPTSNAYQALRNESGSVNSNMIERQSPLIQHRTASPAVHSISPIDHGMVHGAPVQNTNMMESNSTMLKFTYEKHPNSRLTSMQEDEAPTSRRSRSHSIDGNNGGGISSNNNPSSVPVTNNTQQKSKGRVSKKRGSNAIATPDPIESPTSVANSSNCSNNAAPGQNSSSSAVNLNNNNNSSSSNNSNDHNVPALSASPAPPATSKKMRRMSTIESSSSPSTSRTPDVMYSSSSSSGFSGLKFGYESQTPAATNIPASQQQQPTVVITQATIKDSPPSSPGSEIGTKKPSKKQKTSATTITNTTSSAISPVETKENKLFHNGIHAAAHMLGNQLNPSSSMAPKLTDTLNMEIETHLANATPLTDPTSLVGPTYPGKLQANRSSVLASHGSNTQSLSSMLAGSTSASGNTPQSLEQLLERQWEQGSQFLMEQAQHFDIASLLSCLHQLKSENVRLEEHVTSLVARRDHLLAVNARLAIPLNPNAQSGQGHFNNMHPAINGPSSAESTVVSITSSNNSTSQSSVSRQRSSNSQQQQQQQAQPAMNAQPQQQYSGQPLPLENGIDFRHSSREQVSAQQIVRHSSGSQSYSSNSSRSGSMTARGVYSAHQATIRRDDVKPS